MGRQAGGLGVEAESHLGRTWNVGTLPEPDSPEPTSPVWITPKLVTRQSMSTQAEQAKPQEGPKREEQTAERVLRATQDTERTTSQHLRLPGTVIHWFCFVYIKNQTQDSRNLVMRRRGGPTAL